MWNLIDLSKNNMIIDFMEKVLRDNAGLEEEDGHEDDRIPDLLKDLYDA